MPFYDFIENEFHRKMYVQCTHTIVFKNISQIMPKPPVRDTLGTSILNGLKISLLYCSHLNLINKLKTYT